MKIHVHEGHEGPGTLTEAVFRQNCKVNKMETKWNFVFGFLKIFIFVPLGCNNNRFNFWNLFFYNFASASYRKHPSKSGGLGEDVEKYFAM